MMIESRKPRIWLTLPPILILTVRCRSSSLVISMPPWTAPYFVRSRIWSAPVEANELIDQRIDHIFFRPGEWAQRVKVESTMLAGEAVDGIYPSDHRAAVCELSWSAGS